MSTPPSPQRPLYAWLAAGAAAALIASSVFVSIALTPSEAALKILPRPQEAAQAELSARSCGRIRLGLDMRCLAWNEPF